jgi:hypothetical protein
MRVLAILFGVGTAVGIVAGVSAAPVESGKQLAQAQDSGAQSGMGTGASQRGSAGSREGGAAASGASQERGAGTRQSGDGSTTARSETTRASRTTVRERAGDTRVSVHGGTRRVVGVRATTGDDAIVIRRKRARGYVYNGPSTTVIRKKRTRNTIRYGNCSGYHRRRFGRARRKRHTGRAGAGFRSAVEDRYARAKA